MKEIQEINIKLQQHTLAPSDNQFDAVHYKIRAVKFLGRKYIYGLNEKTKNWYCVHRNRYSRRDGYKSGLWLVEVNGKEVFALISAVHGDGYTIHVRFPSWYEIPFLLKYYKQEIERYFSGDEERKA